MKDIVLKVIIVVSAAISLFNALMELVATELLIEGNPMLDKIIETYTIVEMVMAITIIVYGAKLKDKTKEITGILCAILAGLLIMYGSLLKASIGAYLPAALLAVSVLLCFITRAGENTE